MPVPINEKPGKPERMGHVLEIEQDLFCVQFLMADLEGFRRRPGEREGRAGSRFDPKMEEFVRALAACLHLPEDLEAAEFLIHDDEFQAQRAECLVGQGWTVKVGQLVSMIGDEVHLGLREWHGGFLIIRDEKQGTHRPLLG